MTLTRSQFQAADIRIASVQERQLVTSTMLTAFAADPMLRWAYPEPQRYLAEVPAFVEAFAGEAFANSTAFRSTFFEGAALWLPPGVGPDEERMVGVLQRGVSEAIRDALFPVLEQMGTHHPHEPHWYLPLVGVDPAYQGRGIGGELLRKGLDRADADGVPAYLEATSLESLRLYQRFGFELTGKIQAGGSPALWPMVRQPR